jgi:hypothetical protein
VQDSTVAIVMRRSRASRIMNPESSYPLRATCPDYERQHFGIAPGASVFGVDNADHPFINPKAVQPPHVDRVQACFA